MASPSIEQIIAQIRTALFGKDVRENIALGIEKCYAEVPSDAVKYTAQSLTTAQKTQARTNIDAANTSDLSQNVYTMGLSFDEQVGLRKLFDPSYYESGRLNPQGNVYDDPEPHFTSDFIPVRGGQIINFTFETTDYHHRVAEYDNNKQFINITPYSSATSMTLTTNSKYIRFSAPIAELNTAQIYTTDMLGPKLDNLKFYLDLENNVLGYSVFPTYNFAIYDPSNETEIGTEIGVTYTLPGDSFAVNMKLNPKKSTRQRIYAVVAFSGAIYPNRIIAVNIYDSSGNVLPSIERQVSKIHDGINYTILGIELDDTDNYDMLNVLVSYGFSTSGRDIKIEKAIVVNDLPVVPKQDVYIDAGPGRSFPTFTSVFNYCKGRPFVRYHVRWYGDGTPHDISLENGNTDPNGLYIPENVVEIVGAGDRDDNIIIDSYNNGTGAAFWVEYGVTIRNIYFKGTGKYCIHIDDPHNINHDTVIENCRFYHASGGSGSIGVGFQAQYTLTIRNNWFERDTDAGIRVHNWDYGTQNNNHLIIEGNKFSANAMVHAIHLYTVSRYDYGFPICIVKSNDFNGLDIMLSEEDYQNFGIGNHWRVWGQNNSETSVTITHHDNANYSGCVEIFMPTAEVTDTKL